jgi:hypothetical protein
LEASAVLAADDFPGSDGDFSASAWVSPPVEREAALDPASPSAEDCVPFFWHPTAAKTMTTMTAKTRSDWIILALLGTLVTG